MMTFGLFYLTLILCTFHIVVPSSVTNFNYTFQTFDFYYLSLNDIESTICNFSDCEIKLNYEIQIQKSRYRKIN
jgi:hypothetical protein